MNCPGCQQPAAAVSLDGHHGRTVTIDVCAECHGFWFDRGESLQLSPAGTLTLFRMIGEQAERPRHPGSPVMKCPRCASRLLTTHDRQRNVAFQYRRCPHGHGRFTTYYDFLREKNFIRPASPAHLAELRSRIQTVNCANCGAPVDLATGSACAHCRSPLSILDLEQAGRLIEQLRQAGSRPIDPAPPLRLEPARREAKDAFTAVKGQPSWLDVANTDLVGTTLAALARWLKTG